MKNRVLVVAIASLSLFLFTVAALRFVTPTGEPTQRQMIGQMIMIGFPGSDPQGSWAAALERQISDGEIGGVLFLGHNFKTPDQVKALTSRFNNAGSQLPPLLAVDMEGGLIQRIGPKLEFPAVPSAAEIGLADTPDTARHHFGQLARLTRDAGFNMNLAPVVDLAVEPANPVIVKLKRSYGHDGKIVAAFATAFVEEHRKLGVLSVLKHFPGHGSSRDDSHDGFVDISATWTANELEPFNRLIRSGHADAIMPGHLVNEPLNGDSLPMVLSQGAITGLLRSTMGYDGLVISDDLEMKAIRDNYPFEEVVVRAINAGVDVLMIANGAKPDKALAKRVIDMVSAAIDDGRVDANTIRLAHQRIVKAKTGISQHER